MLTPLTARPSYTYLGAAKRVETGVSALTPIATRLCYHMNLWIYASVNTVRENDQ